MEKLTHCKEYYEHQDYVGAEKCFLQSISSNENSDHSLAYYYLGLTYERLLQDQKAIYYLEKAAESTECLPAKLYYILGVLYDNQQNDKQAIRNYQKAITLSNNNHTMASYYLGKIYFSIGDNRSAKKCLENAIANYKKELFDNLANIYRLLGDIFLSENNHKKAEEYYKDSIGENGALHSEALNKLGAFYERIGQPEKAKHYFDKAQELENLF